MLQRLGTKTFFRPRDAAELGVDSRRLRRLVDAGSVERVARGLYHLVEAAPTEHYTVAAVCSRVPGAIVCLLLYFTLFRQNSSDYFDARPRNFVD